MRLRRGRIFLRVLSVSEEPCSQKAESGIITAEQVRYHDCYVKHSKKERRQRRMADTKRLYYEDVYIKEFRGTVAECRKTDKGYRILLDQSAFYPEGYQSHRRSGGRGGTDPLYRGTSGSGNRSGRKDRLGAEIRPDAAAFRRAYGKRTDP